MEGGRGSQFKYKSECRISRDTIDLLRATNHYLEFEISEFSRITRYAS